MQQLDCGETQGSISRALSTWENSRKGEGTHQSAEPFKGSRDSDRRVDFDQNALGGVDVDLKPPCLVEWRVEQGQKALQSRREKMFRDQQLPSSLGRQIPSLATRK